MRRRKQEVSGKIGHEYDSWDTSPNQARLAQAYAPPQLAVNQVPVSAPAAPSTHYGGSYQQQPQQQSYDNNAGLSPNGNPGYVASRATRMGIVESASPSQLQHQQQLQQQYARDLDTQIAGRQARDVDERKKRWEEEKRAEQQAQEYNPWGRPGAGAPRRDAQGHIIASRSPVSVTRSPGASPAQHGNPVDASSSSPYQSPSMGNGGGYQGGYPPSHSNTLFPPQAASYDGSPSGGPSGGSLSPNSSSDSHARFRAGGDPWMNEEKSRKYREQMELQAALKQQMEEKERQKREEREKRLREEEREEQKFREYVARQQGEKQGHASPNTTKSPSQSAVPAVSAPSHLTPQMSSSPSNRKLSRDELRNMTDLELDRLSKGLSPVSSGNSPRNAHRPKPPVVASSPINQSTHSFNPSLFAPEPSHLPTNAVPQSMPTYSPPRQSQATVEVQKLRFEMEESKARERQQAQMLEQIRQELANLERQRREQDREKDREMERQRQQLMQEQQQRLEEMQRQWMQQQQILMQQQQAQQREYRLMPPTEYLVPQMNARQQQQQYVSSMADDDYYDDSISALPSNRQAASSAPSANGVYGRDTVQTDVVMQRNEERLRRLHALTQRLNPNPAAGGAGSNPHAGDEALDNLLREYATSQRTPRGTSTNARTTNAPYGSSAPSAAAQRPSPNAVQRQGSVILDANSQWVMP